MQAYSVRRAMGNFLEELFCTLLPEKIIHFQAAGSRSASCNVPFDQQLRRKKQPNVALTAPLLVTAVFSQPSSFENRDLQAELSAPLLHVGRRTTTKGR